MKIIMENIEDNFRSRNDIEFPISDNYGEGFSFKCDDKDYITKGRYDYKNNEYRTIKLKIYSYGVQHYYAEISIGVDNVEIEHPNHTIGGYLGGVVIPHNYENIKLELIRNVTEKEKEDFPNRWGDYDVDDTTDAFYCEEDIITLFKELLSNMVKGKWSVDIDSYHTHYDEKYLIEI